MAGITYSLKSIKTALFIITVFSFTFCSKDEIESNPVTGVAGNSYVAESEANIYTVYKMGPDSIIDIEERTGSVHGELVNQKTGRYNYNHPDLKLKIQSIDGCENCFNYFDAEVENNRRSFSYEIWNAATSEYQVIIFNLLE